MLRKKEAFTVITPIPGFIPRQLALDILHSHSEVISLNPLVIDHKAIPAPRNAAADEFYSTWYEIVERIQYVPGTGKLGSGLITFNGCFHNMPWGLQTHIHAPMNIDMRHKYRVAGNQPGVEPPEQREIGLERLGAPADGLYLRVDTEIKCNITMVSYVKSQMKTVGDQMVQRIIKKAELLDAGVLKAMLEDGKLKTINPNDRSNTVRRSNTVASVIDQSQRPQSYMPPGSPNPQQMNQPYPPGSPSPQLMHQPAFGSPTQQYAQLHGSQPPGPYSPKATPYQVPQIGQYPTPPPNMGYKQDQQNFAMELPGDSEYLQAQPGQHNWNRDSNSSYSNYRWSQQSQQHSPGLPADPHRASISSTTSSGYNHASPGLQQPQTFLSELPAHSETAEEHRAHK